METISITYPPLYKHSILRCNANGSHIYVAPATKYIIFISKRNKNVMVLLKLKCDF